MKKIIYIDTETTGLDSKIHGLTEVAFIIEIDGKEVEKGLLQIDPLSYAKDIAIEQEALYITNKTLADITEYQDSYIQFREFMQILDKYIDKFDKNDRFTINGYNTNFDIGFIKEWFKDNQYNFYSTYFSYKELDVFALVKYLKYLGSINTRDDKLKTICDYFGIPFNPHNALDDIIATKKLNGLIVKRYINDIFNPPIGDMEKNPKSCTYCDYCKDEICVNDDSLLCGEFVSSSSVCYLFVEKL